MAKIDIENLENVIINTGNILSIDDITKKPNHNTTEELIEAIKITIKDINSDNSLQNQPDHLIVVRRQNDDLSTKLQEYDISELKIGVKIFLNRENQELSLQAIEQAFLILHVNAISDVIITFKQNQLEDKKDNLDEIKNAWKILESLVHVEKIKQLGIADIEESTFRALYEWAEIKPSIIQINLATCCVVPPTLQTFCKEKGLKLLTHSDSSDLLPVQSIQEIFGKPLILRWALRFTIHVKCRGVLITKGYLINFTKG